MNRQECMRVLNDKSDPLYKELSHIFRTNYNNCRKYYDSLGYKGYTLHHKIFNCNNYEEWKIDEIEPMTREEHSRLHISVYKQGIGSESSLKKAHEALSKKYKSGEVVVWNKGLTKETDSRIKQSPRKGKTGDDFPFLKASKKGKSGGWNRGITSDDPRYNSLKHSDEQKKRQSDFMKNHNPMFDEETRKHFDEAIKLRSERYKGAKKFTNGIETHLYKPGEEPGGYVLLSDYRKIHSKEK